MTRTNITKTQKSCLLIVLLLVLVAAIAVTFAVAPVARAAEAKTNVAQFDEYMASFAGLDEINKETLTDAKNEALWWDYIWAKTIYVGFMTNEERGQIADADTFKKVDDILNSVYDLYIRDDELLPQAYPTNNSLTYADNGKVEAVRELVDEFEANEPELFEVLKAVTYGFENLELAEKNMKARKAELDAIATLIDAIEYYDAETAAMVAGNTEGIIVLASEGSIEDVTEALEKLTNSADKTFISNIADYNAAVAALAAQYAKAEAVTDMIEAIEVEEGKVYYTKKAEIEAARAAYEALLEDAAWDNANEENFNDLQSLVDKSALEALKDMEDKIEEIEAAIADLLNDIANLPEADYSEKFDSAIKAAEAKFEALDEDIKDHDTSASDDYIVSDENNNYGELVAARNQYDAWRDQIKQLEEDADVVIAYYLANDHDVNTEALDIMNRYQNLPKENQKLQFRTDMVDFEDDEQLSYFLAIRTIINAINAKYAQVQGVNDEINDLYYRNGKYSYADRDEFKKVKAAFDAKLEEDETLGIYISNAWMLEEMEEAFNETDKLVAEWIEAVEAIEATEGAADPVTVSNWDAVKAAKAAFDALNEYFDDAQDVVAGNTAAAQTEAEAAAWAIYSVAAGQYEALAKELEDLAAAMEAIVLDDNLDLEETTDWAEAVNAITARYNKLLTFNDAENCEDNQEWFQENYAEEWANYLEALTYIDRYNVEGLINALPEAEDVQLSDKAAIVKALEANAAYIEKYTEERQGDIRNYDKLVAAKEALDAITAELNAWILEVIQLANPDFESSDIAELEAEIERLYEEFIGYPLNLNARDAVEAKYQPLVGEEDAAARAEYLENAYDFLAWLEDKSYEVTDGLNDAIDELVDKGTLDAGDIEKIKEILETIEHLDETQKEQVTSFDEDFKEAIAKLNASETFKEMINNLYEDVVVNGNVTSLTPYYVDIVRTLYTSLTAEYQAIYADDYALLDEIMDAYNEAVENGTVLALNEVKKALEEALAESNDNIADLQSKVAALEAAKAALEAADANFEAQIAELEAAIAEINATIEALSDRVEALEEAKAALKAADEQLQKNIDDAIADAEAALAGAVEDLEGKIAAAISKAEEELADAMKAAQSALEAAVEELEDAIADLDAKVDAAVAAAAQALAEAQAELEGKINDAIAKAAAELAAAKADLEKAMKEADAALQGNIDEAVKNAAKALADAQAALEAADKALQGNIDKAVKDAADALAAAKADLEKALSDLEEKMNKADEALKDELMAEIAKLNKSLTVASVVLAVVLACACVCIIVLFVKKKA